MKSEQFATARWAESWEALEKSPEACEQGTVSFDAERGITLDIPFGEILGDSQILVIPPESALPESMDWLFGFSQDGYWLALKDVTLNGSGKSIPGGPYQYLRGSQLLRSRKRFNPEEPVIKASMELVGLREWFGRAAISTTQSADPAGTLTVSAGLDDRNYNEVLLDDAEYRIEICHSFHVKGPSVEGVSISHDCALAIDFKSPQSLAEAEETLAHIADFFSFSCGFFAEVKSVGVTFKDGEGEVSCYLPFVEGASPKRSQLIRIPFNRRFLKKDVPRILGSWVYADKGLKPSMTLLCSLMFRSWKLPGDLRLIAASQLLEALSKYRATRDSLPFEEFKARRAALKTAIKTIEDKDTRQWAMERLPSNTKGQKRLLEDLIGRHSAAAKWLFPDSAKFVKRQVALRNRFTHRDAAKQPMGASGAEELYWHTETVLLFCYLVVADIIGLDPQSTIKKLEDAQFKYSVRRKSIAVFAAGENEASSQEGI